MIKIIITSFILSISLFGASASDCREYENKFNHYKNKNDINPVSKKRYSMLMVKSYFDSIILECKGKKHYNKYVNMIPQIKKEWKNIVPANIRNLPQNKWKY